MWSWDLAFYKFHLFLNLSTEAVQRKSNPSRLWWAGGIMKKGRGGPSGLYSCSETKCSGLWVPAACASWAGRTLPLGFCAFWGQGLAEGDRIGNKEGLQPGLSLLLFRDKCFRQRKLCEHWLPTGSSESHLSGPLFLHLSNGLTIWTSHA